MTAQLQAFPPTEAERLATIRNYLAAQCEKADKSVDSALSKRAEVYDMLATFDAAMEARRSAVPAITIEELLPAAELSEPPAPRHTKPCPACEGDGRPFARDGSRNGARKCKVCDGTGRVPDNNVVPCVVVLYPGDDEPHVTEVGPFTRYSELVADWMTVCPGGPGSADFSHFQVVGEDDGLPRTLSMDIPADDHGKRLIVAEVVQDPAA